MTKKTIGYTAKLRVGLSKLVPALTALWLWAILERACVLIGPRASRVEARARYRGDATASEMRATMLRLVRKPYRSSKSKAKASDGAASTSTETTVSATDQPVPVALSSHEPLVTSSWDRGGGLWL